MIGGKGALLRLMQAVEGKRQPIDQYLAEALEKNTQAEVFHLLLNIIKNEPKIFVKEQAGNCIVEMGQAAIESLTLVISNVEEEQDLRSIALSLLSRIGGAIATETLATVSKNINEAYALRERAIKLLAKSDSELATPIAIAMLNDQHKLVRLAAINVLENMANPQAYQPLIERLNDTDFQIRAIAVAALSNYGPSAFDLLLSLLKHEHANVRKCAAIALGKTNDKRVVKPLLLALADQDYAVRICATQAVSRFGERKKSVIREILRHKYWNTDLRLGAIEGVGELQDEKAVIWLLEAVSDNVQERRLAALVALGQIEDRAALQLTIELVRNGDEDFVVRLEAARTLGILTAGWIVGPIVGLLREEGRDRAQAIAETFQLIAFDYVEESV